MEPYLVRQSALALMRTAPAVILTTLDEHGIPWTRAMLNLWNAEQYPALQDLLAESADSMSVFFTTNTSSPKMRHIENNPRVAVYYHRPEEWWGLMLSGTVKAVFDAEQKRQFWQPTWSMYYPAGPADEDFTLLQFRPEVGRHYCKLQSATIEFERE